VVVRRGSEYHRWDLKLRGGLLGGTRLRMAIEEHGWGKQLVRLRLMPTWSPLGIGMALIFAALAAGAGSDHAWWALAVLASITCGLLFRTIWESGSAVAMVLHVVEQSTAWRKAPKEGAGEENKKVDGGE
jgi:hypothetical protein